MWLLAINVYFVLCTGKETPSAAVPKGKESVRTLSPPEVSASPMVPPTPTFGGGRFDMPPTPRFHDFPPTPNPLNASGATPMSMPSTPAFGASENTLFGSFTSPKEGVGGETPNKSPPKRGRGRPKKHSAAEEEASSKPKQSKPEDIMDIVTNVTRNISSNLDKGNDDAPFELTWTGPMATPSSVDGFASSSSVLPPYTPLSTPSAATPFQPPMGSHTPFTSLPGMKTPFSGGMTPFQTPSRTPLQTNRVMSDLSAKQSPGKSPVQTKQEDTKKRRPGGRKKVNKELLGILLISSHMSI